LVSGQAEIDGQANSEILTICGKRLSRIVTSAAVADVPVGPFRPGGVDSSVTWR